MDLGRTAGSVAGVVLCVLGALWFLPGAALIEVCPILCFAECECVSGGSAVWEAAGAVVFLIGIAALAFSGIRAPKRKGA